MRARPYRFFALLMLAFAACADEPADEYADAMAEEHAEDTTQATAIVMEPMIPVEAETVTYADGVPATSRNPPGPTPSPRSAGSPPARSCRASS